MVLIQHWTIFVLAIGVDIINTALDLLQATFWLDPIISVDLTETVVLEL